MNTKDIMEAGAVCFFMIVMAAIFPVMSYSADDGKDNMESLRHLEGIYLFFNEIDPKPGSAGSIEAEAQEKLRQAGIRLVTKDELLNFSSRRFYVIHMEIKHFESPEVAYSVEIELYRKRGQRSPEGTEKTMWGLSVLGIGHDYDGAKAGILETLDRFVQTWQAANAENAGSSPEPLSD